MRSMMKATNPARPATNLIRKKERLYSIWIIIVTKNVRQSPSYEIKTELRSIEKETLYRHGHAVNVQYATGGEAENLRLESLTQRKCDGDLFPTRLLHYERTVKRRALFIRFFTRWNLDLFNQGKCFFLRLISFLTVNNYNNYLKFHWQWMTHFFNIFGFMWSCVWYVPYFWPSDAGTALSRSHPPSCRATKWSKNQERISVLN